MKFGHHKFDKLRDKGDVQIDDLTYLLAPFDISEPLRSE